MQTPRGKRTRERIMKRANDIIFKFGSEGLALQQIAKDIEISQPALYNHFKNKDALLHAVSLHAFENYKDSLDKLSANTAADKRLKQLIEAHIEWHLDEPQKALLIFALDSNAQKGNEWKQVFLDYQKYRLEKLQIIFDQGKREGLWTTKANSLNSIDSILMGHTVKAFHAKIGVKLVASDLWSTIQRILR